MRSAMLGLAMIIVLGETAGAEGPVRDELAFPLDLAIVDPNAGDQTPPYIVMFEEGIDIKGRDVRRPLGRLEALRGASRMFPESNKDPGLPVVMRGLRLHRLVDTRGNIAGYELELQGEYNSVKVPVREADVSKFLAGEPTTFSLKGQKNYGVFSYVSTITMHVQFRGDDLIVYRIDGDFTFREGFRTYTSATKRLAPPEGRDYLYRGERAELPMLPLL